MLAQEGRWGELLSGKNLLNSVALSGGVALHAINIYVATTVLPSVVADIGGLEWYAWNTTLFVIASILGSALTSKLMALANARAAYAIAGAFFIAGSIGCALAPNMAVMLAGRTLQGFGGGALFALCYAMIYSVFDQRLWPRAMALISGMWGVATLLGPAVGGVFAEMGAWRAAFGILAPITILYIIMVWRIMPNRSQTENVAAPQLPVVQLILLTLAVLVVSIGSTSPDPLWNIGGLAVAALLLSGLVRRELTSNRRLLPQNALRWHSPLLPLYLTIGLLVIGMTSETFVPYFLQVLHGQTPLVSGYLAAMMAAGWTVSEVWSSGWQARGIRNAIVTGPVLVLAGMLILAFSTPHHDPGDAAALGYICLGLTLVGFGIGLGWPHLLTQILHAAPAEDKDTAATSITTVQLFATALGSALGGMFANLGGLNLPGGIEGASGAAWWLFIGLAAAPLLACFSAVRVVRHV